MTEGCEDTVPYLPPLTSYPVQIQITDVCQGLPRIYPDGIFEYDELDEDGQGQRCTDSSIEIPCMVVEALRCDPGGTARDP
jgi:hypothetical protein